MRALRILCALLAFLTVMNASMAQTITSGGHSYGPPWSFEDPEVASPPTCDASTKGQQSGPFPTILAATQGMFAQAAQCLQGTGEGISPPSCWSLYPSGITNSTELYEFESQANQSGCIYDYSLIIATEYPYDPTKNDGDDSCQCAGDPINLQTGNEFREDTDLNLGALTIRRYYNSDTVSANGSLGYHWRSNFDRELVYSKAALFNPQTYQDVVGGIVSLVRADGKQLTFSEQLNGTWTSDSDVASTLTEQANSSGTPLSWTYFDAATRNTEQYDAYGDLTAITDQNGQTTTISNLGSAIQTVTDSHGRTLTFKYTALGFTYPIPNANVYNSYGTSNQVLTSITLPDGGSITYSYDTSGRLTKVTYPDNSYKQYVYNESTLTSGANLPYALTGDIDETNTRFTSIGYNAQGLGISSTLPSSVNETQLTYNSAGTTTATYPLGNQTTVGFTVTSGSIHTTSVSAPCGVVCHQPNQAATYDSNGYLSSATDFNGNVTKTTYDVNGLLDQKVDASGSTVSRTTTYTWNTTLRVPLSRAVTNASGTTVASTQWVYNSLGQVLAECDIDPTNSAASGYTCSISGAVPSGVRRTVNTYCTAVGSSCPLIGLLLTTTGPRTDLTQTTTYSYYLASSSVNCGTPGAACYQAGDLHTVTDALGHVTTIVSYDADGRVTRSTDANGVNTDTTYYPRGWLKTRTVGGAETSFTYTAYGAVQTITDADNITTTFGYDTAHRLTKITDALGNYIQYTLDAAGDKTDEKVYDSTGTLHKSLGRTFNTLSQLTLLTDGLSHTVFSAGASGDYDANGNLVQSTDGLGFQRQSSYDALNRLQKTIANYDGTDTATKNTTTSYAFDSLNRLTQVTDPSSLNTTYSYDGLSDAVGRTSPDTGSTIRTFDAAGDVLTSTDAKGIGATNTYDALNRLITTSYADTTQNVTYTYDEANSTTGCSTSYPIGRPTRVIEHSVTTVFCYDARGNIIEKQQTIGTTTDTTGYSISAGGRLSGIVYPSGTLVSYTRDGDGRITGVNATPPKGATSTVVSSVTYQPFGPVSGYKLGNSQTIVRTYDANYRLTDLTSPAFNLHVLRDVMGDITAIGNASGANPATENYNYDPLYRLTAVIDSGTTKESVTYNPTGDRLSKSGSGLATGTYTYNTGTHQLNATGNAARTVDADGNTTAITEAGSTYGFGYSDRNRMTVAQLAGSTIATYTYNALNERIEKVTGTATERYDYNEGSQLLGEYGATTRDYIWMDGIPVADVDTSGSTSTVAYVTADQLGTARAIANSSGTTEWQLPYQSNPWNEVAPTISGYTYNLRFPGQYFDQETGFNYNINRDYDSATGRYIESDPTGLRAGPNTYTYVRNSPLMGGDRLGLQDEEEEDPYEAWEAWQSSLLGPNQADQTQYQIDMEQGECMAPGALPPPPLPSLLPSALAADWQGSGQYPGVDAWTNTTLSAGNYVVGATPGQSAFYTTLEAYNNTDGSAAGYYDALQIAPNTTNPVYPPYREGVTIYEVNSDTPVATSNALANPGNGAGGAQQFYVPGYQGALTPVYSIPFVK